MIFTHLAPNETFSDSIEALKATCHPWNLWKGRYLGKLRNRIKKRFVHETSSVFLFLSGRSALYLALKSLEIPRECSVLVQAFTSEAVILPIIELGLQPVYVDIEEESYSMDSNSLKKRFTENSNAKILILQHTFGIAPVSRTEILELAKEHKCLVIEDVAHGFDEQLFKKKPLNTTLLLSMGRSKPFSAFFGGAVITRNKKLIQSLSEIEKKLSFPSFPFILKAIGYKIWMPLIKTLYPFIIGKLLFMTVKSLQIMIPEISSRERKGSFDESYVKALPDIFAHFAVHQLKRYNDVVKRRTQISDFYNIYFQKQYNGSLLYYPLCVEDRVSTLNYLKKNGVFLGSWYSQVIGPHGIPLERLFYKPGSCPKAEEISRHIVNLPTNISKKDAKRIVKLLDNHLCK
jgi:dTDP-4-amino-4,6-dideoxygalactose transaminase